jgi:hypothetical protein
MAQRLETRSEQNLVPLVLAGSLVVLFFVSISLVYPTLVIGAATLGLGAYYWRSREYLVGPAFALMGLVMSGVGTVLINNHADAMEAAITLWP